MWLEQGNPKTLILGM